MKTRQPSLKRPLIAQYLISQLVALLSCFLVLIALLVRLDSGGLYTDQKLTSIIAKSIVRKDDGNLGLQITEDFETLKRDSPSMWFVASDAHGRRLSFGQVPPQYASLASSIGEFVDSDIRARDAPYILSTVIRRENSAAGELTILGHGKLTRLTYTLALAINVLAIPIFLVLALVSLIATPWVVRRALAGVSRIAQEAANIDVDSRGMRLSDDKVPKEIGPLVKAVNEALSRLDEGYERQQRFIASAAHELRTPIAVLRAKLEMAPEAPAKLLSVSLARLSTLAEQLLDIHQLDQGLIERLDLSVLVRQTVADLAPLVIGAGKTIEVQIEQLASVNGSSGAIQRVITNLIQNAVEHGGQRVMIRVIGAVIEVEDDGPGIPLEERDRVFEPFHRLHPRLTGAGLGLNLVQLVMERHRGKVSIMEADNGGTIVRAEFPSANDF